MYDLIMRMLCKARGENLISQNEWLAVSEEIIAWYCTDENWLVDNYGA